MVGARRLQELANRLPGELCGADPTFLVTAVRELSRAGEGDLAFVDNAARRKEAEACTASVLMVPPDLADLDRPLLVVEKPAVAITQVLDWLYAEPAPAPAIHPTAIIGADCEIALGAHIGAYAVVGAGSKVADLAVLHAHVVVGKGCSVGVETVLYPHVVLYDHTELGDRVIVHAGTVLGADGFGYTTSEGQHLKVPQVGRLVVEDEVEIGANSAVDRATLEETRIGAGSKIDNLVQVGHNVTTGRGCILCGQAGIAGSARLGNFVVLGGQAGSAGHIELGDGAQVAAKSAALQSVEPGRKVAGIPAIDLAQWRRQVLGAARQSRLAVRLRGLEKRLRGLETVGDQEEERA